MIAIYRNAGPPPHMTDELHMFHDSISGHSGALFIPVSLPYNHSVIAQGRKKKELNLLHKQMCLWIVMTVKVCWKQTENSSGSEDDYKRCNSRHH